MYLKYNEIMVGVFLIVFSTLNIEPVSADDLKVPAVFGIGTWIGYSDGHFQESIYSSEPIDGISGGLDLFMEFYPLHFWISSLGVRGTLCEINYIPANWIKVTQMDLNLDIMGRMDPFEWLHIYGFGGATLTGLSVKYSTEEEKVSEEGKGFRYGGGIKGQLEIGNETKIRFGPEFVMGHLMFYTIIYHYQRLNFTLDIIIYF